MELTRPPVAFLSGTREIAAGFKATRATRRDKKMEILLHLAPMPGAEEWIQHVLTTIANAKAGNGNAIQILSVTQKDWDAHASVSPAALEALKRFLNRRKSYEMSRMDSSLSWVWLTAELSDIQEDFGASMHNIEKFEGGMVIKAMQRVGDLKLPPELEGHVIGLHMSQIPKRPHFQALGKKHPRAKKFSGYTPVDMRVRYKGVGGAIKLGVSFGPNGTPDDIPSQIISAFRRGYLFSSWSWGTASNLVNPATRALSEHAIAYMTALGGLVGVASGDEGAKNGTDEETVDNPAEYIWSLAYGGTSIPRTNRGKERYWNDDCVGCVWFFGVSSIYTAPYRLDGRRLVPDISGIASPLTGFTVFGGGDTDIMGGTSVIPWLMKEIVRISAKLGVPLGAPHPWLYRYAEEHGLVTPVLSKSGKVDERCGLGTPVLENWLRSLEQLVAEGRKLPVPEGFQWATFGAAGAALHVGELGGGFHAEELDQYCDMIGVPHLEIDVWGVNGGRNKPEGLKGDSAEVVLDVDVVADAADPRSWQEVPASNNVNNNNAASARRAKAKSASKRGKKATSRRGNTSSPSRRKKAA